MDVIKNDLKMEDEKGVDGFVSRNQKWLIGLVFIAGMFFARTEFVGQAISTLSDRVKKKTDIQNDILNRVENLEKRWKYQDGLNEGFEKAKQEFKN